MSKVKLKPGPFVVPMPAVLVGAMVEGRPNFMPAAFVTIANLKPPTVVCGLSPTHHTSRGITASGCFSINVPGPELVTATDWCGLVSGAKTDKSAVFEVVAGEQTGAPLIQECRLTAECRLLQSVPFAVDTAFFGEIVGVWADEETLTDGEPDWRKISPLLFTFPDASYWRLGDWAARAWSVGKGYEPRRGGA
jgi:flavin reductase (DIM6/NTAB) family NADH-FMN oxidoreductase RutF